TDRLLTLSESLPTVSIAIDTRERIERALPEVRELAGGGLTTLERARLIAGAALEPAALAGDQNGTVKLTLYGGRAVRAGGHAGGHPPGGGPPAGGGGGGPGL